MKNEQCPLVALVGMVFALYPIRQNRWARSLLLLTGGLFLLWVLSEIQTLLFPFVVSFVLAYLLDPVIDGLQRWRIPRTLAILLVVGLTLLVLIGLGIVFVPRVVGEIQSLIDRAPEYASKIQAWLRSVWGRVRQLNLPMDEEAIERGALDEISRRLFVTGNPRPLQERSERIHRQNRRLLPVFQKPGSPFQRTGKSL